MNSITQVTNAEEHQLAMDFIEPLLKKGFDNLSEEEEAELSRVSMLIADYDKACF